MAISLMNSYRALAKGTQTLPFAPHTPSMRSVAPFLFVSWHAHPYSNGSNGDSDQSGRSQWSENKKAQNPDEQDKHTDRVLKAHMEQLRQLRSSSTVMERTLTDPLATWARTLSNSFGSWFQGIVADVLMVKVEKEFDLQEWLEGAKDAFWMGECFPTNFFC